VLVLGNHILDLYDQFEVPEESRAINDSDVRLLDLRVYGWPTSTIGRLEQPNRPTPR
jgi:hypothetical protein